MCVQVHINFTVRMLLCYYWKYKQKKYAFQHAFFVTLTANVQNAHFYVHFEVCAFCTFFLFNKLVQLYA